MCWRASSDTLHTYQPAFVPVWANPLFRVPSSLNPGFVLELECNNEYVSWHSIGRLMCADFISPGPHTHGCCVVLQALQRSGRWTWTGFGGLGGSDRLVRRCSDSLWVCRVKRGMMGHNNEERKEKHLAKHAVCYSKTHFCTSHSYFFTPAKMMNAGIQHEFLD